MLVDMYTSKIVFCTVWNPETVEKLWSCRRLKGLWRPVAAESYPLYSIIGVQPWRTWRLRALESWDLLDWWWLVIGGGGVGVGGWWIGGLVGWLHGV